MSVSAYHLTFAKAYSHYLAGDITEKGLIGFYLRIHSVQVEEIFTDGPAKEKLRMILGLEQSTFHKALTELHVESLTHYIV